MVEWESREGLEGWEGRMGKREPCSRGESGSFLTQGLLSSHSHSLLYALLRSSHLCCLLCGFEAKSHSECPGLGTVGVTSQQVPVSEWSG